MLSMWRATFATDDHGPTAAYSTGGLHMAGYRPHCRRPGFACGGRAGPGAAHSQRYVVLAGGSIFAGAVFAAHTQLAGSGRDALSELVRARPGAGAALLAAPAL